MKPLNKLTIGQKAVVDSILPDATSANLLSAMGVLPGTTLEVTRFAPLGDPMAVVLNGTQHISLRKAVAADVTVKEEE